MNPAISAKTEKIVERMLNKSVFLRYLDYNSLIKDLRVSFSQIIGKQVTSTVNIQWYQPASPVKIAADVVRNEASVVRPESRDAIVSNHRKQQAVPSKTKLLALVITCVVAGLVLCAGIIYLLLQSNKVDSPRVANDMPAADKAIAATYSPIPTTPAAQAAPTGVAATAANPTATADASTKAVPIPWLNQDVGATGVPGSASYAGGIYTLNGAGGGAYYLPDEFHYVYRSAGGDCSITARVLTQTNTTPTAKAGVMIRESLGASSAFADMVVTPSEINFQYRDRNGKFDCAFLAGTAPNWVRVERVENTFTGYASADGVTWTQVGTTTMTMSRSMNIGLVQSGGGFGVLGVASFDHVTVGGDASPVVPAGLGAGGGKVGRITTSITP